MTLPNTNFQKVDFWGQTPDELIAQAKAKDTPLFATEKAQVEKFRVGNLQRLKALSEIATVPAADCEDRYVTHNSFNAFSWIDFFCERYPVFEQVYITSYNFGEGPIQLLLDRFDAQIFQTLTLVISESIRFRMPKRFEQMRDGVIHRNTQKLRMAGVWNHSKIILLKPADASDFFVIEGSGNFSENAYIEQYIVNNSQQIYEFHQHWIEEYVFNPANKDKKRHFVVGV